MSLRNASNSLIIHYTYDAAGRLLQEDKGNGTYTVYGYDTVGQLASIVNHASNGTVNSQSLYTYDIVGRRTSQATLDGTWTYSYDLTDQLTSAVFISTNPSIANQDLRYEYDALGNRIRTILNGATTDYATNAMNQYTTAGSSEFFYDLDGNLVREIASDGLKTYTYDLFNRLVSAETPEGTWQYEYDVFGNRVAATENGQRTEFLVDPTGMGSVIGEYDGSGIRTVGYDHGIRLVSQIGSGGIGFYDFDGTGSTTGVSTGSGSYANRYAYDPFGESVLSTESVSNRYEFNGAYGVASENDDLRFMHRAILFGRNWQIPEPGSNQRTSE